MGLDTFERIVEFSPAFDRRDPDPAKSYGIHGVELRMVLQGPLGATQFVLYTNWQLPAVTAETDRNILARARHCGAAVQGTHFSPRVRALEILGSGRIPREILETLEGGMRMVGMGDENALDLIHLKSAYHPIPADRGHHWNTPPNGEGNLSERDDCPYTVSGKCYYGGSGLNANRTFELLLTEGSEGVWRDLEDYYRQLAETEAS